MTFKNLQNVFVASCIGVVLAAASEDAAAGRGKWRPPSNSTTNTAPTIGGTPATSVAAGSTYSFAPSASDAQNNRITFLVSNKPAWATFNSGTGKLSGTPTAAHAGTYANIVIRASDGKLFSSLPPFAIQVYATTTNSTPAISGSPATTTVAGTNYSFTPSASDADGNALGFSVSNKPVWASFSTATGALAGIPSTQQTGNYAGIVITVSDGTAAQSLPAFNITVTAPAVAALGSATLSWSAPAQNTDGSPLIDLSGYRVFHGLSANALTDVVDVPGAANTTSTFGNLPAGTHYFAVAAFNSLGAQSSLSTLGSKTIP